MRLTIKGVEFKQYATSRGERGGIETVLVLVLVVVLVLVLVLASTTELEVEAVAAAAAAAVVGLYSGDVGLIDSTDGGGCTGTR